MTENEIRRLQTELAESKATCKRKTSQLHKCRAARDETTRETDHLRRETKRWQAIVNSQDQGIKNEIATIKALGEAIYELQNRGVFARVFNRPPQIAVATSITRSAQDQM